MSLGVILILCLVILLLIILILWLQLRERRIRVHSLWILPTLVGIFTAISLSKALLANTLGLLLLLVGFLIGVVMGLTRGWMTHIQVAAPGEILLKGNLWTSVLLVAILLSKVLVLFLADSGLNVSLLDMLTSSLLLLPLTNMVTYRVYVYWRSSPQMESMRE
jgi:hypothetical protein